MSRFVSMACDASRVSPILRSRLSASFRSLINTPSIRFSNLNFHAFSFQYLPDSNPQISLRTSRSRWTQTRFWTKQSSLNNCLFPLDGELTSE